ncbi:MAG: DUF3108 domain-containing protein [Betaproteobacteria bacterium]
MASSAILPSDTSRLRDNRGWRARPSLWIALLLSLALHALWSLWPAEMPTAPEDRVLSATLTEMPAPPVAKAPEAPRPKPRRPAAPKRAPPPPPVEPPVEAEPAAPAVDAAPASPEPPPALPESAPAEPPAPAPVYTPPAPPTLARTLPPRVELAYKVFLGTQGFLIGEATYRFEHEGDRYHIATVAQARGLAALFFRGRGKVESRGLITPAGLKPLEFAVERGSSDRREVARFDWDANTVTLHNDEVKALTPPAFDPMTVMWQAYFTPPAEGRQTLSLVTTRRVVNYTIEREATETIEWAHGAVETERWHRRSDDGSIDAYFWLAPRMHYAVVKMRVSQTSRGTVEALLDAIRVDEPRSE